MSLTQLMRILWARKLQFFTICISVLALALIATVVLPKKYTAEAAIVVDMSGSDPLASNNGGGALAQLQPAYLATQIDVIASHNVALKVVDQEKLSDYPVFKQKFINATDGKGSIRDWLADALLDSLKVRSSHNGNVIYIQYSSTSAEFAARIAEACNDLNATGKTLDSA